MSTKVLEISKITIDNIAKVANTTKEKEQKYNINNESTKIKSIRTNKKNNIVLTYLNLFIKRLIDIIGGLIGTIILIPLSIVIAIINIINKDYGPLFYSHIRIGKNGKHFKMYKFRTMVVDADKKLEELLESDEETRKEWDENRKLKNDPRITKVGNFLRKTSLDEWPQFLLVLFGKMSLVGPRAVVDSEIEKFGIYKKDILSVKPGIT